MLTNKDELVFLTPPPKNAEKDIPSKKTLSRTTSKNDKLSLSKVRFFLNVVNYTRKKILEITIIKIEKDFIVFVPFF